MKLKKLAILITILLLATIIIGSLVVNAVQNNSNLGTEEIADISKLIKDNSRLEDSSQETMQVAETTETLSDTIDYLKNGLGFDLNNLSTTNKENNTKYFDLSLKMAITSVQDEENIKEYNRTPQVNTISLLNGNYTTASYRATKDPICVSNGNIITYTIRVYNEGNINGYVTEIKDYLPPQLEFIVNDELNAQYGWILSEDERTITTNITSPSTNKMANRDVIYEERTENQDKVLLKAFDGDKLSYIDVKLKCKVKEGISLKEIITNIAEITGFEDEEHNEISDRDSQKNNFAIPSDEKLSEYKQSEIESGTSFIDGQQDDDDFEKVVLQRFDLNLKEFITKVNNNDITGRAPVFKKIDKNKFEYSQTKDILEVANGSIVTYTIRVFNEGNIPAYVSEIKNDLPDGVEFLPDNEINKEYKWKMYTEKGEETTDAKEAKYIRTNYLSKETETESGKNLLKEFEQDNMQMPNYKDIKVALKICKINDLENTLITKCEISDSRDENNSPIEDIDSQMENNIDSEDDMDKEEIKVIYFDLKLEKWVDETIVTYDGQTTVTKTEQRENKKVEAPAKVEIKESILNDVIVKFKFVIKVTNEAQIAGYAKQIIDYVPEGLKFEPEDNMLWKMEDGKILTDQLSDKLLQPGESATVEITLTWVNDKNNLGEKINLAEIYKDENELESPDKDSITGNNQDGEDDLDSAPVIISVATGSAKTYIGLVILTITIITSGVVSIKKFVV